MDERTVFDLDDEADEERFLDWLCHDTYLNAPSVRLFVDEFKTPRLIVHLHPETIRIEPAKMNLIVGIGDDLIHVIDDWVASQAVKAPTTMQVRQIVCRFGFSKEQRTLAERRANEKGNQIG
jgi:hypothetical protein